MLTLTDISALDQARARLAQLSAIVESSDDAIVGKTLDGIITTWNHGAARLYGYSADEAIGRHVSFLQPPGPQGGGRRRLRQVRDGRPVERLETPAPAQGRHAGRRVGDVLADSRRTTPSSAPRRSRATSRSWFARAQEIAEREERIRLLLDSTAEAIYGIDLSGVCIFCNAACARLLGYELAGGADRASRCTR